jgi:anti-sigma-K factor RskA
MLRPRSTNVIAADRDFAMMRDYIVGRLSEVERRAFENRLVSDPGLARELEESLALREGLQQLRTQGNLPRAAARAALPVTSPRLWRPALAAAALVALGR